MEFFIIVVIIIVICLLLCPLFQPSIHPFNRYCNKYLLKSTMYLLQLDARQSERTQTQTLSSRGSREEADLGWQPVQWEVPRALGESTGGRGSRAGLEEKQHLNWALGMAGIWPGGRDKGTIGNKNSMSVGPRRDQGWSCPAGAYLLRQENLCSSSGALSSTLSGRRERGSGGVGHTRPLGTVFLLSPSRVHI